MVAEISIPATITPEQYPVVEWSEVDGNVFAVMATASSAWKRLDRGVAERIGKVIMNQAESYEDAVGVCLKITQ